MLSYYVTYSNLSNAKFIAHFKDVSTPQSVESPHYWYEIQNQLVSNDNEKVI